MPMPFDTSPLTAQINAYIESVIHAHALSSPLDQALKHATKGGKRVRALLCFAAFQDLKGEHEPLALKCAAALELIHAYSLVHDDMPCMDDDALRRGQPTVHVLYGEATAMLVGDVLQTLAFEQLLTTSTAESAHKLCTLGHILASASRRMVNGQLLDLQGEGAVLDLDQLKKVHANKTGALLEASVRMGAVAAGASQKLVDQLCAASAKLGLAFQVQDDVLDVTATTEQLGKPQGSDSKQHKSTYVSLLGVQGASSKASQLFDQCVAEFESLGAKRLAELSLKLSKRGS